MSKRIICRDLKNNKFKVNANKLTFRPSVYGILIKDNKVLLSKQWNGYDMPGGGVKIYETLEEALKREFFEETGLKIKVLDPIYVKTDFFRPSHSAKHRYEYWNCPMIYYLVKKVGGKISKDNFDDEEKIYANLPEWVDIKKIGKLKFFNSIDSSLVIKKARECCKQHSKNNS